jgi:uncharacterized membrane protein YeiH
MDGFVIQILEILGTIAFAVSGALIAVSCSLDLFGVVYMGCVTACGGGIIRDILIGKVPPSVFDNSYIIFIATLSAIAVFIIAYINRHHFDTLREKLEKINNVFDAIGLSVFSVVGVEVAISSGFDDKKLFCILMGMLTGVGGGIMRDVFADKTPYVFKKHIYAMASLLGSALFYALRVTVVNVVLSASLAMILVFSVRMLATIYLWKLPKVHFDNESL